MKQSLLFSIFSLLILLGCSKPLPQLDNFDRSVWTSDPKGCNNSRSTFIESVKNQKDKLKGLSERDLVKLLGPSDRNDLSEHHGKTYYYFITPGPGCTGVDSVGLSLIVRFNATGVSREVAVE
jgi:hypothetical protein